MCGVIPKYSNGFNVAITKFPDGTTNELQLTFIQNYLEQSTKITEKGSQVVTIPSAENLFSTVLTRQNLIALLAVLKKSLGDEFNAIIEVLEDSQENN